jgi:hypothetical protein
VLDTHLYRIESYSPSHDETILLLESGASGAPEEAATGSNPLDRTSEAVGEEDQDTFISNATSTFVFP